MGEEQDSWFKDAFGVDLGQSLDKIKDEASAVVDQANGADTQTVEGIAGVVEGAGVVTKSDERIDAGGATERAPTSGAMASPPVATEAAEDDPPPSLFDAALQGAEDLAGRVVEGVTEVLDEPGIALNDAGAPDAGPRDAGAPDAGPADAAVLPDPTFQDIDRPFNVRADDPAEFVNKGNEYLGRGIAGHMTTDTLSVANAETDSGGRVVRANLLVRTTTERPRWVAGRTRGDEKAVIEQAEELIHAHEERHRAIMKDGMTSAVSEMRGKPKAEADKILAKWIGIVDQRQNALDAREGRIEIIQSEGRMTGARLLPR